MPILDLSTLAWRFRDASTKAAAWLPATVPGCVHTDLRAAGKIPDPFFGANELDLQWIEERDWEYRATFRVSAALLREECVELCADGLDTIATVTLNGSVVATSDNMFTAHRWRVKPLLKPGANTLVIRFRSALDYIRNPRADFTPPIDCSDMVGGGVRIRKQPCQFGWDWGPRFVTAGIWRALRIEAGPACRLSDLRLAQHHSLDAAGRLAVTLSAVPELTQTGPGIAYTLAVSSPARSSPRSPRPTPGRSSSPSLRRSSGGRSARAGKRCMMSQSPPAPPPGAILARSTVASACAP
jgi:beta-mannosidase